ncbi:SGNH/GDSL hydrolase family protein [Amaricoccus tamworthensis]|uniref:SGNH/GDSL hydrolase family protein n=1 Tax=Amaricoccus tamworthensis TaxID=57002 RepID=UPI003C7B10BE
MGKTVLGVLSAAAIFAATSAHAVVLNHYTSLSIFGDSLSDPGNLFAATGGAVPANPPYPNGRFTNLEVWAEPVTRSFTGAELHARNYAFGGANAVTNDDAVPDLEMQLGMASATTPEQFGSRPMLMTFVGANDGFDIVGLGTNKDVTATAVNAANTTIGSLGAFSAGTGVRDLAFFSLPDLGMTPAYGSNAALSAQASLFSDTFNATLDAGISNLRDGGFNVLKFDTQAVFDRFNEDPSAFGLASTTIPCVIPDVRICSADEAKTLLFYDGVHPNNVGHETVAGLVQDQIAPVPLPPSLAFVLAGFGALLLAARKRPV